MLESHIDKIVFILQNLFALCTLCCYLEYFLEKKSVRLLYIIFAYMVGFSFLCIIHLLDKSILINMIAKLICILSITMVYKRTLYKKISAVVFFYVLAMVSEFGVSSFFGIVKGMEFAMLVQDSGFKFLMIICSQLLLFMIIKVISCFSRQINGVELPLIYWGAIFAIPTGSIFLLHIIFSYSIVQYHVELHELNLSAIIIVLGINFIVFYLYERLLIDTATRMQNAILEGEVQYYAMQYEETENMQKEVSTAQHNLKNQLIGIQGFLKEKNYERLESHLDDLLGKVDLTKRLNYSGNTLIDSILYNKISYAKKDDILVDVELNIPQDLKVSPNNFCVILGNAMDNAIEACRKLEKQERRISIKMGYEHCTLHLEISNPYRGKLKYNSNGDLISSKEHRKKHGFGVKSIKQIIDDEDDFMTIDDRDQIFKLKILIFDKKVTNNLMVG